MLLCKCKCIPTQKTHTETHIQRSIKSEMEREGEAESVMRSSSNTYWPLLKGCLAGEYYALLTHWNRSVIASLHHHSGVSSKLKLHQLKMANTRMLRLDLIGGVTYAPLTLGLFDILSNKLRSSNDGRPLSLYQEACCGFACGGAAALLSHPFVLVSSRITAQKQNFNYRKLFGNLHRIVRDEGVLALWRGSGLYTGSLTAANVGMLASYNRSRDYLMESRGLSKWNAILSASIISGFFGAACSHPYIYLKEIKDAVLRRYVAGRKNTYKIITPLVIQVLTPHSGFKFYVGFVNHFRRWAVFCVVQRWIYEKIRVE